MTTIIILVCVLGFVHNLYECTLMIVLVQWMGNGYRGDHGVNVQYLVVEDSDNGIVSAQNT